MRDSLGAHNPFSTSRIWMRTGQKHFLLIAVQAIACTVHPAPASTQGPPCSADAPSGVRLATGEQIAGLAGAFALVLVNTVTGWTPLGPRDGALELWPNAPARRGGWPERTLGRKAGPRPLVGRVQLAASGDVPGYELAAVAGSDHPEVEVVGADLHFGAPDAVDGAGYVLRIVHVSPSGFWGTWTYSLGIGAVMDSATGRRLEDPAGFFCAVRRS